MDTMSDTNKEQEAIVDNDGMPLSVEPKNPEQESTLVKLAEISHLTKRTLKLRKEQ